MIDDPKSKLEEGATQSASMASIQPSSLGAIQKAEDSITKAISDLQSRAPSGKPIREKRRFKIASSESDASDTKSQ